MKLIMGFCGGCGKQSSVEDRFCTGCGTAIKESKISVLEDTSQIIKEEYKQSTAPPEASISPTDIFLITNDNV